MTSVLLDVKASPIEITTLDYSDFANIERVSAANLTYDAFFHNYMLRNRAVIITGLSDSWDCYRSWLNDSNDASQPNRCLNVDYLCAKMRTLRSDVVPVADCSRSQLNAHCKLEMPFAEYATYWKSRQDVDERLLYLKDWHLRQAMPEYQFYTTPRYFASDWLNESLVTAGEDDYRFVYIGPEGTWSVIYSLYVYTILNCLLPEKSQGRPFMPTSLVRSAGPPICPAKNVGSCCRPAKNKSSQIALVAFPLALMNQLC